MPSGLRASDAPLIHDILGRDQRLLLRIGALLQDQLAVTRAVLEEVARSGALRDLLMDRRLKDCADEGSLATLSEERGCADLELYLADDHSDGHKWRVIAFLDEADNPLLASASEPISATDDDSQATNASMAELLPSLSPQLREPIEGLLKAQADDARAAALEQLRYAAPPLPVLGELMPMILLDGAELVRERAIAVIVAAGASPLVIDLIRALQRDDQATIERLAGGCDHLDHDESDLVIAAIFAVLGQDRASQALIHLATALAERIAVHRGLERLLELGLPQHRRLSWVLFIRRLQACDRPRVDQALLALLGQTPTLDAQLICLLAHPDGGAADHLLSRGVDLLLASRPEPAERMALAAALRRLDHDGRLATKLASHAATITDAYDTTAIWLLAELARAGLIDEDAGEALLRGLGHLFGREQTPHLISVIEQQLPALLPGTDATRRNLVEPLAELCA
ncbi:MAG: hypothetical protein ACYTF0_08870, partial [Planctomycetota bacterium]